MSDRASPTNSPPQALAYERQASGGGFVIDESSDTVCIRVRVGGEPNKGISITFLVLMLLSIVGVGVSVANKGLELKVIPIAVIGVFIFGLLSAVAMAPLRIPPTTITATANWLEDVDPLLPAPRLWQRPEIAALIIEPLLEISPNGPLALILCSTDGRRHRLICGMPVEVESAASSLRRVLQVSEK